MPAIFPLALLGVAVALVAVMPWHHPHPNHLFFLDVLSGQPTPSTSKAFADDCAPAFTTQRDHLLQPHKRWLQSAWHG